MVNCSQYLKVKIDPAMPPDQVNIEQDGKVVGSIINLQVDIPSIEALKANLYYYELLKMQAFDAHKKAIIDAHEAMTALNNALLRKYHG